MIENQKYFIWEPLLLALMVVVGMLIGWKMSGHETNNKADFQSNQVGAIEEILRFVEAKYVDSIDREALNQAAVEAILANLDPHSKYIAPDEVLAIKEDMEGSYYGVGMSLSRTTDSLWAVSRVIDGSPADIAEIKPGYILHQLDTIDLPVEDITEKRIQSTIRGEQGTDVSATFLDYTGNTIKVTLNRQKIPISSIELSEMLNDSIGIIGVNRFSSKTYQEFMRALEELYAEGLNDLIIDLRSNPGGYLQETVKILSQFIEQKGLLLVYTEGENSKRNDYQSNGRIFHPIDDIIILIDENSASASEIMAGCLQDLDRALVLGRRSFGKGLVQEQYDLTNGGAIRLTTGRYYTPSGRLIQKSYDDSDFYHSDLQNRHRSGELTNEDQMPVLDSSQHYTTSGRVVYGGGGVTPDIFVKDENPFGYADWPVIYNAIKAFALSYIPEWQQSKNMSKKEFVDDYEIENAEMDSLISFLTTEWPILDYNVEAKRDYVQLYFKAFLGLFYFNSEEVFYLSIYKEEKILERASEIVKNNHVDKYLLNTMTATRE